MITASDRPPADRVRLGGAIVRSRQRDQTIAPNGLRYDHRFIASTDSLASDLGVILVDAWNLERFLKRPRWMSMHDIHAQSAPINQVALGRVVCAQVEGNLPRERTGVSGRALIEYVRYARTPFAQEVKVLYEDGGLDDVSVRWDPSTEIVRAPTSQERRAYGDACQWVATRVDQLELSAVVLGADPGAQHFRGVREKVVAAFERVRAGGGNQLPYLETLIRETELQRRIRIAIRDFSNGQSRGSQPGKLRFPLKLVIKGK